MSKLIVDTSVLIDYIRRKDRDNTLFRKIREDFEFVISFITVSELFSGKSSANKQARESIQELLDYCQIMMVDINGAKQAGELRRDFDLSLGDGFIAQLALEQGLILATLNTKDFGKVKGIKLYKG